MNRSEEGKRAYGNKLHNMVQKQTDNNEGTSLHEKHD